MPSKRVLIADYEKGVRESLALVFAKHGCECRAVDNGDGAVAAASGWMPDVIVLDFLLMGMNGVEVAGVLKERCPGAAILLLASTSVSPLLGTAEDLGLRIFQKPVRPEVLLEAAGVLPVAG